MSEHPIGYRELRPEFSQYQKWFRRPEVMLLAVLAVVVAGTVVRADSGTELLISFAVVVASVVVGVGWVILSIRTSSVRLGHGRIEHRSWFFRKTTLPVEDGIRGVFAVYEIQVSTRARHLLVLTGGNRGRRIRLSGAFWNEADLTVIADYAGVSVTDQALDVKGFEERVPGIMNPWERHPVAFGVATAFVVVALVVVAVLGFFYLADIPFGSDRTM